MTQQNKHRGIFFAKTFTVLAALSLLLMPISALGSRFGIWPAMIGLGLFALSALGGLIIEVIVSFWLWRKPQNPIKTHLRRASLLALPPLIITAGLLRGSTGSDLLHDITTDTVNPPHYEQAVKLRGEHSNSLVYSPEKKALQEKLYPEIRTIKNALNAQKNYDVALQTITEMGLTISKKNPPHQIEAVASTYWFGFKDDVVIRIHNNLVDIRSISRIGQSDLGANAKRIQQFTRSFEEMTNE